MSKKDPQPGLVLLKKQSKIIPKSLLLKLNNWSNLENNRTLDDSSYEK